MWSALIWFWPASVFRKNTAKCHGAKDKLLLHECSTVTRAAYLSDHLKAGIRLFRVAIL